MLQPIKAMIVSVGGSPEPIIVSLKEYRPEFVCFFASEQSVEKIWEIKNSLDFSVTDRKVLLADPQNLTECYRKSLECVERVREAGFCKEEVLVDFTGGTKPMSGMLLVVGLAEGYNFVYVGGTQREKNNLGVVKTGTEVIVKGPNPWHLYAVEQRKKLCLYFNRYQFTACQEIILEALAHCQKGSAEEELFRGLKNVVEGYLEWDRFKHDKARECLKQGASLLDIFARLTNNMKILSFLANLHDNLNYLNDFASQTKGYQELSRCHILDLLANARRRYSEGKYDDAVARLYRSLEMTAQWKLKSAYNINTSQVSPEQVPASIREQYIIKYGKGDYLQIPLAASFGLLYALGDPMGEVFTRQQKEIDKILYARNHSILAHGTEPVGKDLYVKFAPTVTGICGIDDKEIPVFPSLDI